MRAALVVLLLLLATPTLAAGACVAQGGATVCAGRTSSSTPQRDREFSGVIVSSGAQHAEAGYARERWWTGATREGVFVEAAGVEFGWFQWRDSFCEMRLEGVTVQYAPCPQAVAPVFDLVP